MRAYSERLVVPASWWLWSTACVALLGTALWAGYSVSVGVAVYVVLEAACAVMLLAWGSARIDVTDTELRTGSRSVPLSRLGEVVVLDAGQTSALRGPRADPAAFLVVRPYLPRSIYIEIAGRPAGEPYWLIGTRKPAQIAEAIERARRAAGQRPPCDDAAGDHAHQAGARKPLQAAPHGKDGHAS